MGGNNKATLQEDPAANAPDAAAADKGKGKAKAVDQPGPHELSEDEDSDEGSGPEDIVCFGSQFPVEMDRLLT